MGFEITYFYKEAGEITGSYNEDVLSKTIKIGKFDEEIPLEVLAGKIIAQLARRNILIVDIEIFEFTKKKISYKETQNGIFIKNKKFNFDNGALVRCDEEEDYELNEILQNEELLEKIKKYLNLFAKQPNIAQRNNAKNSDKKPIRLEVYDPEEITKFKIEQRGYKFTVGKKYQIFSEKSIGGGILNYTTKDDTGREVEVVSDCFVVPPVGLSFEGEQPQYHGEASDHVDLWKNVKTEDAMPDIRRR